MREGLKARLGDSPADSISVSDAIEGEKYAIAKTLPDGTRLVSRTASGSNYEVMVTSGATVEFSRISTGSVSATLLDGGPVRIIADDGPATTASGVLFDSLTLDTSNAST
jgi:hypothetical protein